MYLLDTIQQAIIVMTALRCSSIQRTPLEEGIH